MKNSTLAVVAVTVVFLTVSSQVYAHHSASLFEKDSTTVTGTVSKLDLINPHIEILFDVTDAKGNVEHWIAQGTSPGALRNIAGGVWNKNTLKPGDQITMTGHRIKDHRPILSIIEKMVVNGRPIPPPWGQQLIDSVNTELEKPRK